MGTPPERLGLGGSVNYLTSAPSKSGKSKAHALGHSFGQAAATTSSTRRPAAEQVFTAGQNGAQTTTTAQNGEAPSKSGKSKAHALGHSFGQAAATTSSTRRPAAKQVFTAGQNGAQTTTTAQNGEAPSKSGGKKPGSDAMFANPFDQNPTAASF